MIGRLVSAWRRVRDRRRVRHARLVASAFDRLEDRPQWRARLGVLAQVAKENDARAIQRRREAAAKGHRPRLFSR